MSSDSIKVPVEYTIITTSDWTQFEIIEGGSWENLQIECKTGAEKLKSPVGTNSNKSIRIDKETGDKSLVIVYVNGLLSINKQSKQSDITYKIAKGEIQSTLVLVSANRKKLPPLLNDKSDFWGDGLIQLFTQPRQGSMYVI
jgi:hypothetical protein